VTGVVGACDQVQIRVAKKLLKLNQEIEQKWEGYTEITIRPRG
jgi:hypothetical protein